MAGDHEPTTSNNLNSFNIEAQLPPWPEVPWTLPDVTWAVALSIGIVLALAFVENVAQDQGLGVDPSWTVVFGTILLLIPVWYFAIHKHRASWADLGLRRFHPGAVAAGCGLMLLSLLFNIIYAAFLSLFNLQIQPDFDLIFASSSFPWLLFLGGAIIAPFVEEVFFRGFVFSGLSQRWEWKRAMLGSAVLFAIAHILPTSILPIFILGIIFAFLYRLSGSIWPAILMHMLTNTLALSAAYAISQGWIPKP